MRYPGTTKWNGRAHNDLEKLLHIFIVSDEFMYASAFPTRQGIVTMLGLGRGGSQFYIF